MKKIILFIIVISIIFTCQYKANGKDFFPLKKGNYWVYQGSDWHNYRLLSPFSFSKIYSKYNINKTSMIKSPLSKSSIYYDKVYIFVRRLSSLTEKSGIFDCELSINVKVYFRQTKAKRIDITETFKKLYPIEYDKISIQIKYKWKEKLKKQSDNKLIIFVKKNDIKKIHKIAPLYHNFNSENSNYIQIILDLNYIKQTKDFGNYISNGIERVSLFNKNIERKSYHYRKQSIISGIGNYLYFSQNFGIVSFSTLNTVYTLIKYKIKL